MNYIKILLILCILLLHLSCEDINNVTYKTGQISIVSTLQSGGNIQYVRVCYLSDLQTNGKYDSLVVQDAEVKISGEGFTENCVFEDKTDMTGDYHDYYYRTMNPLKDKFQAGKTYNIKVKAGNFEVNGTTTFPGKFEIVFPKNNDSLQPKTNYTFRWTRSQDAYLYILNLGIMVKATVNNREIIYPFYQQQVLKDTFYIYSYAGSSGYEDPYHSVGLYAFVQVIAVDKNYYDHVYLKRDRSGLDAGYGCFSSGVVDSVKWFYKK